MSMHSCTSAGGTGREKSRRFRTERVVVSRWSTVARSMGFSRIDESWMGRSVGGGAERLELLDLLRRRGGQHVDTGRRHVDVVLDADADAAELGGHVVRVGRDVQARLDG